MPMTGRYNAPAILTHTVLKQMSKIVKHKDKTFSSTSSHSSKFISWSQKASDSGTVQENYIVGSLSSERGELRVNIKSGQLIVTEGTIHYLNM